MSSIDVPSGFLAVILSQEDAPKVMNLTAFEAVASSIRLAEADYIDSGAGDWVGFYDWLRNHQGEVIGVQQWVDESSAFPFSTKFDGVETNVMHSVLRIFFGQSREVDEENSCDQDFGNNRLLVNRESVALTFLAPYRVVVK